MSRDGSDVVRVRVSVMVMVRVIVSVKVRVRCEGYEGNSPCDKPGMMR